MKSGIFVTGTSTEIGKTFISALLLTAAHAAKMKVRYFKPVQSGDPDTETVKNLTGLHDFIMPAVYSFKAPMAPSRAAVLENIVIEPAKILQHWRNLESGSYIVEGAGGLLAPLAANFLVRDLIKLLNLPLVIVASTILGTMNHTLLTIEAAQTAKIPILGVIFSGEPDPGLKSSMEELTSVPILAEIPWIKSLENIKNISSSLISTNLLNSIFSEKNYESSIS